MFQFQQLHVYESALNYAKELYLLAAGSTSSGITRDLENSGILLLQSLAEGGETFAPRTKRKHYLNGRGALLRSVAILDYLWVNDKLEPDEHRKLSELAFRLSTKLFSLIKSLG